MKTLVDVNADVLGRLTLADAEEMWFPSKDGLKVQGWLMKPAGWGIVEVTIKGYR